MTEQIERKPRRTLGLWLMAFIFAVAALMGALRVFGAVSMGAQLRNVSESISVPYLIASGVFTFLAGLAGVGCVFLRKSWVPKVLVSAAAVLSLLYWFDQFFFVENTTRIRSAWGFSVLVNLLLLGLVAWVLTRKRVKAYYQRRINS